MAVSIRRANRYSSHLWCVAVLLSLSVLTFLLPSSAVALTVRTKSDLRLWETVTKRSQPLAWAWEAGADRACLTFSNKLTRAVSHVSVDRNASECRGSCPHPVEPTEATGLFDVTLVQKVGDVEVSRETAEIAYAPGASGRAMTVRTKASRDWWRVPCSQLASYDARWWNVTGPSGYEVLWREPAGSHRVVREFEGTGVVDETVLRFGMLGFLLLVR